MRILSSIAGALVLLGGTAAADTVITGGNITDATWTVAGSPYVVTGDLNVPAGGRLVIEPGVTVRFNAIPIPPGGDQINFFTVAGTLIAEGTAAQPIVFAPVADQPGFWGGIDLLPAAVDCVIEHAVIERGTDGITYQATADSNRIGHVTIRESLRFGLFLSEGRGMHLDGIAALDNGGPGIVSGIDGATGEVVIENSVIRGNDEEGLWISEGHRMTVRNTVIADNRTAGIDITVGPDCSPGCVVTIEHTTIAGNGEHGLDITAAGSLLVEIKGSILSGHSGNGVHNDDVSFRTQASVDDSILWENSAGDGYRTALGATVVLEDPRFVSATDLHLTAGSPAIDRLTTGPATDLDGVARPSDGDGDGNAGYDLGAYEHVVAGAGPDGGMGGGGGGGGGGCCDGGGAGRDGGLLGAALLLLALRLRRRADRRGERRAA